MAPELLENNDVARLYNVVLQLRDNAPDDAELLAHAIARIFSISGTNASAVYRAYAEIIDLSSRAYSLVHHMDDLDPTMYLDPIIEVNNALRDTTINNPMIEFKRKITGGTMVALRFIADHVKRVRAEESISDDKLSDLSTDIHFLFEDITNADIDPELRSALLLNLVDMTNAINMFRIRGREGLRQAVDSGVMVVMRRHQTVATESEENKSLVQRFMAAMTKAEILISSTSGLHQIASSFIQALPK